MLNDYQKGSIFGAVIVAVAFAASFSGMQLSQQGHNNLDVSKILTNQNQQESFWDSVFHDPVAAFTGALVIVGGVQAGLFLWQLDLIRRSLTDAKEASDAAKISADAATRQAKATEESFAKLERPYLFVSGVWILDFDTDFDEFFLQYGIANHGKIPAIVERAWIGFTIDNGGNPPHAPLIDDSHNLFVSPIIEPGGVRLLKEYLDRSIAVESGDVSVDLSSGKSTPTPRLAIGDDFQIFFRVTIAYRGPFTSGHETASLHLHMGGGAFAQRGGNEYNYTR